MANTIQAQGVALCGCEQYSGGRGGVQKPFAGHAPCIYVVCGTSPGTCPVHKTLFLVSVTLDEAAVTVIDCWSTTRVDLCQYGGVYSVYCRRLLCVICYNYGVNRPHCATVVGRAQSHSICPWKGPKRPKVQYHTYL